MQETPFQRGARIAAGIIMDMRESDDFQKKTGYKVPTVYRLPRRSDTLIYKGVAFPQLAFSRREAIDRFAPDGVVHPPYADSLYFEKVPTMTPGCSNGKQDFLFYEHEVYIARSEYEHTVHALAAVARAFRIHIKGGPSTCIGDITEHFIKAFDEWKEKNKETEYFSSLLFIRQFVNDTMTAHIPKDTAEKHRTLAIGMVRYLVGMRIRDLAGD